MVLWSMGRGLDFMFTRRKVGTSVYWSDLIIDYVWVARLEPGSRSPSLVPEFVVAVLFMGLQEDQLFTLFTTLHLEGLSHTAGLH